MDLERFGSSPNGRLVPLRGTDGRTGREYDHMAFVADPLGAEPPLTGATWHAVTAATRALARLDQASRQVLNPYLLRMPTLRREAQSTSALEGTFAPLDQVLAADRESSETLSKEMREVINYLNAADAAFDNVLAGASVTVGLLESAHGVLVAGTAAETRDAGRVRTTPVAIGSPTGTVEDARFVPMPNGTELQVAVRDLTDWIRSASTDRDPLVAAAIAHYQFETLHPFNDGNGRLGRLLIVLHLMVEGVLQEPLLSVSPWFEARRNDYQDKLAEVSATGDWDGWIGFFAEGVRASADDTLARIHELIEVQERYVQQVAAAGMKGLVRDIAESLIGQPVVTVPRLMTKFGKGAPSTNEAVKKLVNLGILDGPHGSYNRQFFAREALEVIVAPTVTGRTR